MEAFSNMGNHLVSNSAAAINASDDISTVDPDESVLSLAKGPRRRRHDDEESEGIEDDDMESLASMQVNGQKQDIQPEEEKELPPHACAYVCKLDLRFIQSQHTDTNLQLLWHS
jgi:regulator of nonsense transcripts 1